MQPAEQGGFFDHDSGYLNLNLRIICEYLTRHYCRNR